MFYDRYKELCDKANEKPYSVSNKIGLGNSNVAQWKKGSTPRPEVLSKIADYFGVTVEYLLTGENEQQKKPTPNWDELDEETIQLREIWASADQEERTFLLSTARMLKARRKK